MKAETLIVCAHGGAADIVEMNEPNWHEHFREVVIISPEDDPLPGTDVYGLSGHHGPEASRRALNLVHRASEYGACCISEADVIFFKNPAVQDGLALVGDIHRNFDPDFISPVYFHPPIWATSETFSKLLDVMPDIDEQGCGDRVLGVAFPMIGVCVKAVGYSQNSIDTPEFLQAALHAVKHGASCVHGVKTREVLDVLTEKKPVLPLGY